MDSSLYEFAAPQTMLSTGKRMEKRRRRRKSSPPLHHLISIPAPQNNLAESKQPQNDHPPPPPSLRLVEKRPRNLDWIIDAIAEGKNVDAASPHSRRQATSHTCEYCGLKLKYPSKIAVGVFSLLKGWRRNSV